MMYMLMYVVHALVVLLMRILCATLLLCYYGEGGWTNVVLW